MSAAECGPGRHLVAAGDANDVQAGVDAAGIGIHHVFQRFFHGGRFDLQNAGDLGRLDRFGCDKQIRFQQRRQVGFGVGCGASGMGGGLPRE